MTVSGRPLVAGCGVAGPSGSRARCPGRAIAPPSRPGSNPGSAGNVTGSPWTGAPADPEATKSSLTPLSSNMNVTALIEPDGDVIERYLYDPYGRVTVLDTDFSADADNKSDYDNQILYCGYRFDPETGLYHVRNRMHHPTLGRWILRDPAGYVDGMGLRQYGSSAPLSVRDPLGEAATTQPTAGLAYMDHILGAPVFGIPEQVAFIQMWSKYKGLQCPAITAYYINARDGAAQFARDASAQKQKECILSYYFGHGRAEEKRDAQGRLIRTGKVSPRSLATVKAALGAPPTGPKPPAGKPAPFSQYMEPRFALFSCFAKSYNDAIHPDRLAPGAMNKQNQDGEISTTGIFLHFYDLVTRQLRPTAAAIDQHIMRMCEAWSKGCCKAVPQVHLYFGRMRELGPGEVLHDWSKWKAVKAGP